MSANTSLTPSQKLADSKFFSFLHSTDPFFVLSGGPGTGKTFLMGHLCNQVLPRYEDACKLLGVKPEFHTAAYCATTNKAAEVLGDAIQAPAQTIHSFLGLKIRDDYKTGKRILEKRQDYSIKRNMLLFVDECSMIDTNLFNWILNSCENCKIIFVGDHAQMAPVGEEISPVFSEVPERNIAYLKEPVRNAGQPALIDLCAQLRETVETGIFHPIQEVPGVIEYLDDVAMEKKMIEVFGQDMNPSSRLLNYTNTRVNLFNEAVREMRELGSMFDVGEHVVVGETFSSGKVTLNVEKELVITDANHIIQTLGDDFLEEGMPELQYYEVKVASIGSQGNQGLAVKVPYNRENWNQAFQILRRGKRWADFFRLKGTAIDLRDKAACTVYKSQGSTYESVFMDLGNIGTSYDEKQVARMLFVGASRASQKVYLYGRLPGRYQGALAA